MNLEPKSGNALIALGLLALGFYLTVIGGLIYAAGHFIHKFW